MQDLMIKVENISKEYRLGAIGGTTLKEELQRLGARLVHKEDPTLKIGEERTNKKGMFMALSNISFEAQRGEAIGIIGHNGAGKSTLLKLITRITAPTAGRIDLYGRVASMLEVGTGFHAELTGRENIYVNGAILGMTKKEIDKKLDEIIDFSECRQFIDTPVKRYSSGMYVKLAFSVAAHLDSEIVIMDEVLAVGDVAFQNKCIRKMKEIASSGRTVLYVSHNMSTIRRLCNRCIVLDKGELKYDGDVEAAIEKYIETNFVLDSRQYFDSAKRIYNTTQHVHITEIEAFDRERSVYTMGEQLNLRIKWRADKDVSGIMMRIVIFTAEGIAAGISYSEQFDSVTGENSQNVMLDTSALLPGKYQLEIVVLNLADNGNTARHDVLREGFIFEMIPDPDRSIFYSYNRDWGYFLLPDARVDK